MRTARAFEEIANQIRAELADGRLKVGSRLPAERTLALQLVLRATRCAKPCAQLEHVQA